MRAHRNGGPRQMWVRAPGDTAGQEERKKMDMPRTVGDLPLTKAKPSRTWALTAGASLPNPPPEPGFQPVVCQPWESAVSTLSFGSTRIAKGLTFAIVESQLPHGST